MSNLGVKYCAQLFLPFSFPYLCPLCSSPPLALHFHPVESRKSWGYAHRDLFWLDREVSNLVLSLVLHFGLICTGQEYSADPGKRHRRRVWRLFYTYLRRPFLAFRHQSLFDLYHAFHHPGKCFLYGDTY